MIIDFVSYAEAKQAEELALEAARRAEITSRVNLEWVLADLIADIEAA
jgi:hypothetical protein